MLYYTGLGDLHTKMICCRMELFRADCHACATVPECKYLYLEPSRLEQQPLTSSRIRTCTGHASPTPSILVCAKLLRKDKSQLSLFPRGNLLSCRLHNTTNEWAVNRIDCGPIGSSLPITTVTMRSPVMLPRVISNFKAFLTCESPIPAFSAASPCNILARESLTNVRGTSCAQVPTRDAWGIEC